MDNDLRSAKAAGLAEEVASLRTLTARLQAENARLLRLLELTPKQAAPPGPVQTGFFDARPGPVDQRSPPEVKVGFFGALFAARTDIYAVRWENARTGKAGWLPAVRGRWGKGGRHEQRDYLPLTREVLRAHLSGETQIGLYPLLDGDLCSWLAADFDAQPGPAPRPMPVLHVHDTRFRYTGEADPSAPGGMAAIYRDLVADDARSTQVINDVTAALERGRHCLVLTQWTAHLERSAEELRRRGLDPVVLRGGMSATTRRLALARLQPPTDGSPLLAVATGPFVGEGFDCPVLDTLFLAAPIAFKGRLVQYVGRVLRSHPGKTTAEVHDYHDIGTGVLASSLAKRAPGYTSLGFPDPRTSASRR